MKEAQVNNLAPKQKLAIFYHSLFDFPLNEMELLKWEITEKEARKYKGTFDISFKDGFYFPKGKPGLISSRKLRQRNSVKKLTIARKYGQYLSFIPTIKFIGLTGSLAMNNASEKSDIDLMVITKKNTLWTTRLFTLLFLKTTGAPLRRFGERQVKDKLCFNLWLDEANLVWPKRERNIFTAHEIAQIVPLINKDKTYENFLFKNSWLKSYWPNAVKIKDTKPPKTKNSSWVIFEPLARNLQIKYMENKKTKEKTGKGKAIFHPMLLGPRILKKLGNQTS